MSKEEGGRHTPFFNGYRPQFYFRTTDVTGSASLPDGVEMVMPGDNVEMTIELIAPIAMEEGLRFAIREGGRTVGAGRVTKIHEVTGRKTPMARKEGNRPKITLACTECKRRNYNTVKNRVNDRDRLEMKKYCRWCRTHTLHRESR